MMSEPSLYKQPALKRKRGGSAVATGAISKSWSECVDQLRRVECTATLTEVGVVVVQGGDALQEWGCFGSQPGIRLQSQKYEQPEIGSVKKKRKVEEEKEHESEGDDSLQERVRVKETLDPTHSSGGADEATEQSSSLQNDHPFYLNYEEAFYLCHNDCLTIHRHNAHRDQPLSLAELWTHLLSQESRFVERYACYWHFRRLGWVPKTGLKFGADFLLYKDGPAMHHSSYAVQVVRSRVEPSEENCCELCWQDVVVSVRVNDAARKEVMICTVEVPPSLRENIAPPPTLEAMNSFNIHCTVVKRWIPERTIEGR